jgi:TPR repeat protein
MVRLANLYIGIYNDYDHALGLLRPAAEQGNAIACEVLAEMYQQGHGVPKDLGQAYLYVSAAGDAVAKQGDRNFAGSFTARAGMIRQQMTPDEGAKADALLKEWREKHG